MALCVYRIRNRQNGKRYYGYGSETRPYKHFKDALRARKKGDSLVANAMRREGTENFELTILMAGLDEQKAKKFEILLIAKNKTNICRYGWAAGYNRTDGGEGTSGHRHTAAKKAQWSRDRKGKQVWSKGAKFSPEHCSRISIAKRGSIPSNKGKSLSPETLKKMSIARKGKPQPNISAAKKGKSNGHEGLPSPLKGRKSRRVQLVADNLCLIQMLINSGINRYQLAAYFDISGSSLDNLLRAKEAPFLDV